MEKVINLGFQCGASVLLTADHHTRNGRRGCLPSKLIEPGVILDKNPIPYPKVKDRFPKYMIHPIVSHSIFR